MYDSNNNRDLERILFVLGFCVLLIGIIYYLLLRPSPQGLIWLLPWLDSFPQQTSIISIDTAHRWYYSLPSLLHVLAFSLLTISVIGCSSRNIRLAGFTWLLISCIYEIAQLSIVSETIATLHPANTVLPNTPWLQTRGTFDWNDLFATGIGSAVYFSILRLMIPARDTRHVQRNYNGLNLLPNKFYLTSVLIVGITSITGSYTGFQSECDTINASTTWCASDPTILADPVYMSFTELRNEAVYLDKDRPLRETGKIYLYNNYIFVNSPNVGIHIYDNNNPYSPSKVTFINIPGNVDIAISQDYLYVDSYIDLLTIDIRDIQSPVVVNRRLDIFPYNPYQNIKESVNLTNIDPNKGVIVGYTTYE
ncbi:MAG: hypothetical protein ACC707_17380 [Thiohalomonadales bacterium]